MAAVAPSAPTEVFPPADWTYEVARIAAEELPPGGTLLDVGCGTGAIARAAGATYAVGVDVNPVAVAVAQRTAPVNCDFIVSDLYAELNEAERFDVITITVPWESAEAYPDEPAPRTAYIDESMVMARALAGAHAHLEPDGAVVVFGPTGLDEALRVAGYTVDKRYTDGEGQAIYVAR